MNASEPQPTRVNRRLNSQSMVSRWFTISVSVFTEWETNGRSELRHETARAENRLVGVRRLTPNGTPVPDAVAPHAAYEVALILHKHLESVAYRIRWATDRPPRDDDSNGPVPPDELA